jgi:Protein of unknown function (DUF3048) N-terminal domain/Protein of unknown function (DUF3048) C-terminal domain
MVRIRTAVVILLAGAVAVTVVGCKSKDQPRLLSAWPVATLERVVPKPPTPPRWPLTGLPAPSAAATKRRVMAVKIENSVEARPQTGLQSADVVYEEVTEGGITRFNSLFQSKLPKLVGPVRSARLADLWIVPQYHALLFFSGANTQVNKAINRVGIPNLSEDAGVSYPYVRLNTRRAPHNLYLYPARGYEEAKRRKMSVVGVTKPLQHLRRSGEGTVTVNSIYVPFSTYNKVLWTYDRATKSYKRANNGRRFVDADTGKQLTAKNVVVMWARHIPQGKSKWGDEMYDITLGGSGRAVVFRSGQQFPGTWTASKNTPPQFKDANGKPVQLERGNTWIEVVSPSTNITLK